MNKIIIIISSIMFSSVSFASCNLIHLNGNWVAYQGTIVTPNPLVEHTAECRFNINNGEVEADCDMSHIPFPLYADGTAEVAEDCSAEINLEFEIKLPNGEYLEAFFDLQLSTNKKAFIGRWENNAGVLGTTNGLKR